MLEFVQGNYLDNIIKVNRSSMNDIKELQEYKDLEQEQLTLQR